MTKPRPWPRHALWARHDAIRGARDIDRLLEEAKRAVQNGNMYKVRLAIVEAQRLASKEVLAKLLAVGADGSEICEQCPYREGLEEGPEAEREG